MRFHTLRVETAFLLLQTSDSKPYILPICHFLLLTPENLPLGILVFTNEELSSIVNSSKPEMKK